ncbi:H-NS family nucleoid-associated regulatory protein [Yoonia sp.]|uniref:H-NS histone family protein n=1 Tax=Yoonia sp. TaxID=2212373 RepID=UPI00391A112B
MSDRVAELEAEMQRIQSEIAKEKGKEDAREQVQALLKKLDYTVEDLFGPVSSSKTAKTSKPGGVTRGKVQARYRNPENKKQTWSGPEHRPKPQWVEDFEADGGDLESIRIAGR